MSISAPFKIGDYIELGVLNSEHGVYLVQHVGSRRVHVLKFLDHSALPVVERLISDPVEGMPRVYEVYKVQSGIAVVEQYVDGVTLEFVLGRRGELGCDEAREYGKKVAIILDRLHKQTPPMIHRDVKPSNVMVTGDGEVYLIDFDAAKFFREGASRDTELIGTSGYAAPEQYGFGASTPETDIFSLGVLMNVLATGCLPNEKLAEGRLGKVVEKCTDVDPRSRYPSAAALLEALNRLGGKRIRIKGYRNYSLYRPLGFRSLTPWKMLLAGPAYIGLAVMCFSSIMYNSDPVKLFFAKLTFFLSFFFAIVIPGNFCGILDIMGISRIKSKVGRITVTVLFDLLSALALMIAASQIAF